jgi:predicted amidohydrolase YtcJ
LIDFQNVHAIGDRANGLIMDVFEATLQGVNISASRPRLEHAQIITHADRERLGRLGGQCPCTYIPVVLDPFFFSVIASVQPTHALVPYV